MCDKQCGNAVGAVVSNRDVELALASFNLARDNAWMEWTHRRDSDIAAWEKKCQEIEVNTDSKGLDLKYPAKPELPTFPKMEDILSSAKQIYEGLRGFLGETHAIRVGSLRDALETSPVGEVAHPQV